MIEQAATKRRRSPWMLLLGPLAALLIWWLNPIAFFSNACRSPFASDRDRATALDQYGDKAAALPHYSAHLREHPDDTDMLLRRGIAYVALGQADPAIADFTEVLRRQPNQLSANLWRGDAALLKHDYVAAIADYTKRIERPDQVSEFPFYRRGLAALGAGRYEMAEADFGKVLAQDANDAPAAKGRDCAARKSHEGECGTLPFDPHPEQTQILDLSMRKTSDCYRGRWR